MIRRAFPVATCASMVLLILAASASSQAAQLWTDGVNGDLSNDRLNPTDLLLAFGSNTVTASTTTGGSDREYFTVNVPVGLQLSGVVLTQYTSSNGISFVAFQNGTTLNQDPTAADPTQLTGYTHFGSGTPNSVGVNFLPSMNLGLDGFGTPAGFTLPLSSGDYTFWSQQTSVTPTTYTFDFQVVPEPAAIATACIGGAILCVVGARRRVGRSRTRR
jgi:hypothetical protein